MRASSFRYLVKQGFREVWTNRVNSFASICIVTISLMMVGISVLVSININRLITAIEHRNEVIVVIEENTPVNNVTLLGEKLKENKNIFEITFVSKDEAMERVLENMRDSEKSLFDHIQVNPLPDCYNVRISDISLLSKTVAEIEALDSVELVKSPYEFASLLVSIRNVFTIVFMVITVALTIVCLVIIANTTRTSVYARRKEINIMRYVGASKSFIRVPFFIEGVVIGLVSSLIAYGLTWFTYTEIYSLLTEYLKTWNFISSQESGLVPFVDFAFRVAIYYPICGILISSFGTVLYTRKHLKV